MTATDYVTFLESMGVSLKVKNGKLIVSPAKAVGPGTIEVLKAHKAEIIAAIQHLKLNVEPAEILPALQHLGSNDPSDATREPSDAAMR